MAAIAARPAQEEGSRRRAMMVFMGKSNVLRDQIEAAKAKVAAKLKGEALEAGFSG